MPASAGKPAQQIGGEGIEWGGQIGGVDGAGREQIRPRRRMGFVSAAHAKS